MTHVLIASLFNPFLKRLLTFIIQMTTRKEKRKAKRRVRKSPRKSNTRPTTGFQAASTSRPKATIASLTRHRRKSIGDSKWSRGVRMACLRAAIPPLTSLSDPQISPNASSMTSSRSCASRSNTRWAYQRASIVTA